MREILFRGKRMDNGEWVEAGSIARGTINDDNWDYYIGASATSKNLVDNHGNVVASIAKTGCLWYKVDLDSIGEYTGLTDRDGKKIFEGDIVKVTDDDGEFSSSDCGYGNVIFLDGIWYVDEDVNNGLFNLNNVYYIETIGNIHDNPNFFEGGADNG